MLRGIWSRGKTGGETDGEGVAMLRRSAFVTLIAGLVAATGPARSRPPPWPPRTSPSSAPSPTPDGKPVAASPSPPPPRAFTESATTGADGSFTLPLPEGGTYQVTIDETTLPAGVTLANPEDESRSILVLERPEEGPVRSSPSGASGRGRPSGAPGAGARPGRPAARRRPPLRHPHRARGGGPQPDLRHDRPDELLPRRAADPGRVHGDRAQRARRSTSSSRLRSPSSSAPASSAGARTRSCGSRCASGAPASSPPWS